MFKIPKKYRRIYYKLSNFELQTVDSANNLILTPDILSELTEKKRPHLFLNFYSEQGVRKALERYGIFNNLRLRGFRNIVIKMNSNDPYRHTVKIFFEDADPQKLLGEMYARRNFFIPKQVFPPLQKDQKFDMIFIEWLLLQNPRAKFSTRRPPLPGQNYQGLRIGKKILPLLINLAQRLKTDGLLNVPENYHNAVFYRQYFKFIDPYKEGVFAALQRDLNNSGMTVSAWAVFLNCVRNKKNGKLFEWFSEEQILPTNEKLIEYFSSVEYVEKKRSGIEENKFYIDNALFEKRILNQPVMPFFPKLTF